MFHTETIFVGNQILKFDRLSSTNDHLKGLLSEGPLKEGLVVQTEYQTSGRGQIGNVWHSKAGENLLVSTYLNPKALEAGNFFYFNMSVCLAVADALNYFHPGFRVKWPNDILFERKKVAGILIENTVIRHNLSHCIVGVGINVNQKKFPAGLKDKVQSLRTITGHDLDLDFVLKVLLKNIEVRYLQLRSAKEKIRKDYFDLLYGYRQEVDALIEGESVKLIISDVRPNGRLIARVNGHPRDFYFKEISFVL